MTKTKLYHGSTKKITDGFVRASPAHINDMKTEITAAFATDFERARLYAAMRIIGDGWKTPSGANKLYVQKMSTDISKTVYIYELDSDGFIPDADSGEYYCTIDKEIKNTFEIDVLHEIKNGNIQVYVLQDEIDFSNLSRQESLDLWRKTLQENKFELYNPNDTTINNSIFINNLHKTSQTK